MSALWFDDIEVGLTSESPGRTITEADVVVFSGLSGDYNELHTNAEFMKDSQFGERIAHGALVLSIVTGLRARSGEFRKSTIAFAEIRSWRFRAPVFIGDTIKAISQVTHAEPTSKADRGVVVHSVEVINQHGTVVQSGEFVTLNKRRRVDR